MDGNRLNSRIESIRRNTRNRITAIGQATGRVLASLLLKALTGTAALGLVVGALWALWGWLFKSSTVVNGALLLGLVLATLFGAGLLAVARWLMAPDSTAHDATPTLDVVELEAVRYIATREKIRPLLGSDGQSIDEASRRRGKPPTQAQSTL